MMHELEDVGKKQCPLCEKDPKIPPCEQREDVFLVVCERCGQFAFTKEAKMLSLRYRQNRHLLSGVTREHWERYGQPLLISTKNVEELIGGAPSDRHVAEKARRLLLAIERMTTHPGHIVSLVPRKDYPLAYCRNHTEFHFFVGHLAQQNLLQDFAASSSGYAGCISPQGWTAIERLRRPNIESDKAFVAMWFNEEMDSVYKHAIKPAIEDDCAYKAIKIDLKEFLGDIVDEIIAEIRESRFIVADFTGQRQGVYYEAGYARGMGLPVILTCRKDEIQNLHFDTRQQNHIDWETPQELRKRLADRIRAIIGLGPRIKQ